ncbi:hypothetical protein CRG98_035929 [Punica granatum]|uniref:Uncharacterized protein n=1 Tax=Punica granatum TaxID=22663 RepID=A0A2I0IIZ4_PUNGR|nr:hypothetical protein CRG98_035929 [Punica granatum]
MVAIIMGVDTMVTDRMPVMNASLSSFAGGALASTIGELLKGISFAIRAICLLLSTHLVRSYKSRMWTVVDVATAMFIGIGATSGHLEKSTFVHFCIRVVGFDLLLMAFSFPIDWFYNRVGSYRDRYSLTSIVVMCNEEK